ncbi:MAG: FAD-binding oxidoreductase [Patescibacteria group bacterium]
MTLAEQLRTLLNGEVYDDAAARISASRDASIFEIKPQLVIAPRDTGDIQRLVGIILSKFGDLSITPRAGATDMTGGPLTGSVVLDMVKHFNQTISISNDGHAVVQPGVFYRDFEKETLKKGWLLPSYPASREICTVGGMVANNAGGEKSLTYGKTIEYVESLIVILADGNRYELKALSRPELDEKIRQNDFEGDLYRRLFKLFSEKQKEISESRPRVSKNSAGYQIWDVWDGKTFNLAKLFTGSQGTLGVITEIKLRLIRPPHHRRLLAVFVDNVSDLPNVVKHILPYRPESLEMYDDKTIKLALRFLPEFVKLSGAKNLFSLAIKFLPEFWMALTGGIPSLILLAEFAGDASPDVERRLLAANYDLSRMGIKTRIARSDADRRKYWAIRHESFNLLRHKLRGLQTVPFIDDLIVLPEKLGEFLPKLQRLLEPYRLTYSVAGHAGEGNIHIIPLMKLNDPDTKRIINELAPKVYDLVVSFSGSITAEHNDGLIRGSFLNKMYSPEIINVFKEIKNIFDPKNIFNPGKKVNVSWNYAMSHLRKS